MSRREPFVHRLYRPIRPVLRQLGISAVARRLFSAKTRQTIASGLGLTGFNQTPAIETDARPGRRFAFVFVCQQGEIEVEAALLAISLKRFLRCNYELIACVPTPAELWGTPSATTIGLLQRLGARVEPIVNNNGPAFFQGNKFGCLKVKTDADKVVYLDSDILLVREFYDEPRFDIPLNAKPTDVRRVVDQEGHWPSIYEAAGVPLPTLRRPSTSSKVFGFPQYNGGFVWFDAEIDLGAEWERHVLLLRENESLTTERLLSDQIGLAVAIQKLGVDVDSLDERYNYPLHQKRLYANVSPYFVHYHYPWHIEQEPATLGLFHDFVAEHPQLAEIARGLPQWEALLEPKPVPQPRRSGPRRQHRRPEFPELIITGIPRSGTTHLCNLLHRYSNCVVVNEPGEIADLLCGEEMIPWGIGMYYRLVRSNVVAGRPIRSWLQGDKVTESSVVSREMDDYVRNVDNRNFVLGTRNDRGYLTHLGRVRRVLPEARVIVCVRNPFATIASWKQCLDPQLRASGPVGHAGDPWLTQKHRSLLETIDAENDLAQKRAMLWHFYAELALNEASNATIVRYEDLVSRPQKITAALLRDYDAGKLREPMHPSERRYHSAALDAGDIRAIRAICSQSAAELGLDMSYAY